MSEKKRAKLTDILARLRGMSKGVGTSSHHALASAAAAPSPTPSTLGVAVPLAAFPYKGKVVENESNENSAEGPISKRLRPMPTMASHSSSTGRSVSPLDHATSVPLFPDLSGTSASAIPPALELPLVLQHALKGFQLGVTVDSDEAAARERLGFNFGALLAQSNALLTRFEPRVIEAKTREETSPLASFAVREAALEQELACLRRSEKDLSKQLRAKCREVSRLEARILPLRIRFFELEEAAEVSKSKIAGLERRFIDREMHLGQVEAELLQQAKRFEEAEAELTGDVLGAYDAGFGDALAQVACAHPGMDTTPFTVPNRVANGQIVPWVLP